MEGVSLVSAIDGFWLPASLREVFLSADTPYATRSYADGRPCEPGDPGAVTARWPQLRPEQWQSLVASLQANRRLVPSGEAFWKRLQAALNKIGQRFINPADPLVVQAMAALPGYTGFSQAMIRVALSALDMMALDQFPSAFQQPTSWQAAQGWQPMPGMPGRLRFYSKGGKGRILTRLLGMSRRPLFGALQSPELVVGFGAGNVPGTALFIALLAQATTLAGGEPPVVVVKNSRQEPIFTPLVLSALEAVDPELLAAVAVLVWDYSEENIQSLLLSKADLVLAAASDETIGQIRAQVAALARQSGKRARFHAHGHKVSFAAISKDCLAQGLKDSPSGQSLVEIVSLLSALDSTFWDQYGCLSARVHFVEEGGNGFHTALEYAGKLDAQLRVLSGALPRGASPRQQLMDQFDRFKLLETTGRMKVLSHYEDHYVLAIDWRTSSPPAFYALVNGCLGRVIVVCPVKNLMEVPERYLRMLPSANLQSLSLAAGRPGEGLPARLLRFAEACGECGVTAIRSIGRGAFPQLAYSWDGLIPLDLVRSRPAGHFTSIEFDAPYEQMLETYNLFLKKALTPKSI
jgi:hypothetical protein